MYETISRIKIGYQHKFNMIRNKKGELVMYTKRQQKYGKNILINY